MDEHDEERRSLILAALAGLAPALASRGVHAQDAAKVAPLSYRVALENDVVRVLDFTSRPGAGMCGVGRHSHPAHLVVALSDATIKVTGPDGKAFVARNRMGDVFWAEAETHTTENIGGTAARALVIEVKARKA